MSDKTVAWVMMGVGTAQVLILVAALTTLRSEGDLLKPPRRPRKCEGCVSRARNTILSLGAALMTALDDALARVTAFVKDVVTQLTGAKEANDAQTGKLAELQVALDTALADDNVDKAAIAALQAEVSTLQDEVAAKINAAVDALENVPVAAEEVIAVEDVPVAEDTPAPVDQNGDTPVE